MSTEDKIREMVDKVKRGEEGFDAAAFGTFRTDEGGIGNTEWKRCAPCNINKHDECKGENFCDCDHSSHNRSSTRLRSDSSDDLPSGNNDGQHYPT